MTENSKMYLVTLFHDTMPISVGGSSVPLMLSWDEDMIGCLPVFNSEEAALRYANGDSSKVLVIGMKEEVGVTK